MRDEGVGIEEMVMISMEMGVWGHAAGFVDVVNPQRNLLRWLLSLL